MNQPVTKIVLKAMVISCKDIMLSTLAKAIVRLAQAFVNETSYCVSPASISANRII